jgi:anaerobic selenocysteine-containing dehydrogenase
LLLLSVVFSWLDPERNLDFVTTEDGLIHLYAPELASWLADVTPQAEQIAMARDEAFPMILMAGWHCDFNANTLMRDPAWNQGRRTGCLAVHPQDAANLDLADGEMAQVNTLAGKAIVEVQISKLTRPGMVLLPHGFWYRLRR